ncbi:ABC-F family ATP-binding cassette domain-containing protein [Chlorobaculum thiosulfatiphilum]|uniref:ABC-F family ATP-binding cassette domain-containing protein n=1 Tax=Chlorobaculum thiosulfatiphilum TaxID=115852 RepID=A0A5C4SAE0_CHLTI|nr:ABC-F family ATP-binding cassette domain-containing protein [Chlorobaculum thiosulfatiphilum]TNJ40406.1 ABC-F family ATP-binding cassette domain-containing protein [Chlorobaculum thiosulfatiphilum]
MVLLTVEGIGKTYGLKTLFEEVSFGIDDRDKVGIIGANGSGKSTLMKILAGSETPDTGRVMISREKRISYLPQDSPYDADDTVLEAVLKSGDKVMALICEYELTLQALEHAEGDQTELIEKMTHLSHELDVSGAWDLESNAKSVLGKLGLNDLTARMGELSGGQRKRVALAHALVVPSDALILDEPTNHLDADSVEWLENYIRRYAGAVILITHDRYFLDRVATRMIELDGHTALTYTGGYASYLVQKSAEEEQAVRDERKRNALAKQELEWMRTGAKARTTKQKARLQRAETLVYAPRKEKQQEMEIGFGAERLGNKIVEFHDVSKSYDSKTLLRSFDYLLEKGDRIGIIGPNGSGKTTLLEMIAGRVKPDSGRIEVGPTVRIGYYDQESRHLDDSKRVIEYIKEEAEQIKTKDGTLVSAAKMLERFLFAPSAQYNPIGNLSGGERRRLYLLRQLIGAPNVLLLDEPTNDLDIPTLRVLEDYLDTFPGCLVVVSHDRYFLDRTVEHIFAFEEGGIVRRYPGNYSVYLDIKAATAAEEQAAKKKPAPAVAKPAPTASKPASSPKQRKLNSNEKRELEQLEVAIAEAEERQEAINAELAAAGSDFEAVQRLGDELHKIQEKLNKDMERWSELAELA